MNKSLSSILCGIAILVGTPMDGRCCWFRRSTCGAYYPGYHYPPAYPVAVWQSPVHPTPQYPGLPASHMQYGDTGYHTIGIVANDGKWHDLPMSPNSTYFVKTYLRVGLGKFKVRYASPYGQIVVDSMNNGEHLIFFTGKYQYTPQITTSWPMVLKIRFR